MSKVLLIFPHDSTNRIAALCIFHMRHDDPSQVRICIYHVNLTTGTQQYKCLRTTSAIVPSVALLINLVRNAFYMVAYDWRKTDARLLSSSLCNVKRHTSLEKLQNILSTFHFCIFHTFRSSTPAAQHSAFQASQSCCHTIMVG